MARSDRSASGWTLWVVAFSCALHAADELLTGWQAWAVGALGIVMPTPLFLCMNAVLVVAALLLAREGWRRRPVASLVIPAATLANALFFHILPSILQGRPVPGVGTAILLYLPFSTWALVAAKRDGVPARQVALATLVGALMATGVVLAARAFSAPGRPAGG